MKVLSTTAELLVVCLLVGQASAAPVVSSVAGSVEHGESVVISGSGFGAKSTAAPVLWDTVDNQSAYSSLDDGDDIPVSTACPWRTNSTYGDKVEYCTSRTMRGQETAHYHWMGKGYLGWPRAMDSYTSNDNQKFYVNYWWNPSVNPNSIDGGKFMRVWDDPDGTGTRISWTSHDLYVYSELHGMNRSYGAWSGDGSQWNNMEIWIDADAGLVKAWVNCDLNHTIGGVQKIDNGIGFSIPRIGFDPRYSDLYTATHNDMCDIYIDVTQARVLLGNASTWTGCTHREIQIPSAWSDTSVTVTVNQGSLDQIDGKYLYVVNDEGVVNTVGYLLVDSTPTLTVTNGSGSGQYDPGVTVPISADSPASGKLFARWIGDTSRVADTSAASTTVTMPASDVSVTATYAWGYQLAVNSGSGSGLYLYGTVVGIQADPAPTNMQFAEWTGDTGQVADVQDEATTFTILNYHCGITATYEPALAGDLDGSGFVGQADLDIILDSWGDNPPADPRADPSGDGFVGQADLDVVLDDWGESTP